MEGWFLLVVLALVIAGSGFVQSSMGFGYAIVALGILPFFVDVRLANIVVSLSVLVPLTFAMWTYRHGLDWRVLRWCLSGAALGLPVGFFVFTTFDADWLVRSTGFMVFLIAVDSLFMRRDVSAQAASPLWGVTAGVAGGILAGSLGMGGPPIAAYAARQHWSAAQFKAFLASFFLIIAVLRALGLVATGWVDQTVVFYSVAAVPFGLAGGYLGVLASRNIDVRHVRRTAMVVLLFLSVGMIFRGRPHERPANKEDQHHADQLRETPRTLLLQTALCLPDK